MRPEHQPPSGWNNCPADILYLVFHFLSPAELHALCLVNKNIRIFTEPFLYSKVQWIWREPKYPPPITKLLRTILCRPQLAAYIKHIHLEGTVFRQLPPQIPTSSAEMENPIKFIRTTRLRHSDLWIEGLVQGTMDASVALLLAQLSNLRCLYLGSAFTQQSAIIGMVLRSAIYEPAKHRLPDFQHLQDVTVLTRTICQNFRRERGFDNTKDILPFFYLPSVQRMSVAIHTPDLLTRSTAQLPVLSRLKSLDLTDCRESYLGEVLSVTKNVETFRWKFYWDSGIHDHINTPIVDLDSLGDAISHIRDTLKDLTIWANIEIGGCDQFFSAIKLEGSLHALVNLDKLQRLQVPLGFLVGFTQNTTKRLQDVLPRNIEFLTLTYDLWYHGEIGSEPWPRWEWEDHTVLGLLQSWLKDWKTCTPNIRGISVILDVEVVDDERCPSMRHQLMKLGAQCGIQLEIDVVYEMW
ncbi:hypothetical protein N7490_010711 [Penicillium lividum]|nr:hypothetical protein N7490_010711 [Penicillium lividum]